MNSYLLMNATNFVNSWNSSLAESVILIRSFRWNVLQSGPNRVSSSSSIEIYSPLNLCFAVSAVHFDHILELTAVPSFIRSAGCWFSLSDTSSLMGLYEVFAAANDSFSYSSKYHWGKVPLGNQQLWKTQALLQCVYPLNGWSKHDKTNPWLGPLTLTKDVSVG